MNDNIESKFDNLSQLTEQLIIDLNAIEIRKFPNVGALFHAMNLGNQILNLQNDIKTEINKEEKKTK